MEVVVSACKNVHSLTGNTGYVNAVYAGEVHLTQGLTVHFRTGNDDTARNKVLYFILLAVPFSFNLWSDESLDGFSISLCTYNEQFISNLKFSLAVRNTHLAIVEQS